MKKIKMFNQLKLSIFSNNRIVIENYNELIDINEEEITVDRYQILGTFLKITKMDNFFIEIEGTIRQIVINEWL